MYRIDDIIDFIVPLAGLSNLGPDDDLFKQHGIYGDDWTALLVKFKERFNIDMELYIWHYHNREEGGLGLFDPVPYLPEEKYIPITPRILLTVANAGYWNIKYPEGAHEQEKNRPKTNNVALYIMIVVLILLILFIYYWAK